MSPFLEMSVKAMDGVTPPFKTSMCRVLVVDNSQKTLTVVGNVLRSTGYMVFTAATQEEALAKINQERIHIAIVDVHLKDPNTQAETGAELIRRTHDLDPTIAIIILTHDASLMTIRDMIQADDDHKAEWFKYSGSLAVDFLLKSSETLIKLPDIVKRVFDRVVNFNCHLHIEDSSNFTRMFQARLQTGSLSGGSYLQGETEELLRKLFPENDRIDIEALSSNSGGYSKAIVFRVVPWIDGMPAAPRIAKVGDYKLIEREVTNYRRHIHGRMANNRSPAMLYARRTRMMGGIVYEFAGLAGAVRDFAQFYRETDDDDLISRTLQNLFLETLRLQHGGTAVVIPQGDLRSQYLTLLRLDMRELDQKQGELMDKANLRRMPNKAQKFWLPDGTTMRTPLDFAVKGSFNNDYVISTIHGDLHTHNVLVDHHRDTWLIDFADTGKGPTLQDYVAFEASLVVDSIDHDHGRTLFEWAKALYSARDLRYPELSTTLAQIPAIKKAHGAVRALRELVWDEKRLAGDIERTFLTGMFFTMLRLMSVKFLTPTRRLHALLSASLLAQRLEG